MTLSQLKKEISLIESEHEELLRKDVEKVEQQFLDQYKYISEGDPIVLDDEFLGYFDHIGFAYGMIELGYLSIEGNDDSYNNILLTDLEELRLATDKEVAQGYVANQQ